MFGGGIGIRHGVCERHKTSAAARSLRQRQLSPSRMLAALCRHNRAYWRGKPTWQHQTALPRCGARLYEKSLPLKRRLAPAWQPGATLRRKSEKKHQ
jgi:hypothetical protein